MSKSSEYLFNSGYNDSEDGMIETISYIERLADELLHQVVEIVPLTDTEYEEMEQRFKNILFRMEDVK